MAKEYVIKIKKKSGRTQTVTVEADNVSEAMREAGVSADDENIEDVDIDSIRPLDEANEGNEGEGNEGDEGESKEGDEGESNGGDEGEETSSDDKPASGHRWYR